MKKFLALMLIALLAVCLFVSCDDSSDDSYMTVTYVFEDGGSMSASLYYKNIGNYSTASAIYSGTYSATTDTSGTYSYSISSLVINEVSQDVSGYPSVSGLSYVVSGNTLIVTENNVSITLTRQTSGSGIVGIWKVKVTEDNYYDIIN